jgi:iron complex outermembrane receptor protein
VTPRAAQSLSLANRTYNDIQQQGLAAFVELNTKLAIFRLDGSRRVRDVTAVANIGTRAYRLGFDGESNYLGLSTRLQADLPSLKNQLFLGYEQNAWDQDRSYAPAAPLGSYDRLHSDSRSYFLKNDVDIKSSGTRISAGYRSERNERSYAYENAPSLRREFREQAAEIGLSQRLSPQITGYTKLARGYRFANLDEFANAYAPDFSITELRPQVSKDIEAGIKFLAPGGLKLQARVYQIRLKDEIIYDVLSYNNINLDRTRRRGLDADGSLRVTRTFGLTGALSIRKAEFTGGQYSGKDIPMSLPKTAMLGAGWQPAAAHRFGIDAQWVAHQRPTGDYDNLYQVPSYWIAHLRYDYRLGNLELSGTVKNLFDRSYYSYATVVPADWNDNPQYIGVYPDNGRSFWLSARYRFN